MEMGSLKNKGNWAILEGTITTLREFIPNSIFRVLSHGPKKEFSHFPVPVLPAIVNVPLGSKVEKLIGTALEFFKGSCLMLALLLWKKIVLKIKK